MQMACRGNFRQPPVGELEILRLIGYKIRPKCLQYLGRIFYERVFKNLAFIPPRSIRNNPQGRPGECGHT